MENLQPDSENPFYQEGLLAASQGYDIAENPYKGKNPQISYLWQMGWKSTGRKELIQDEASVPSAVIIEPLAQAKKQGRSAWGSLGTAFSILLWLGGIFILCVIVLAIIKWSFSIVF